MDTRRSQQYNFVREALPILFHTQTSEFMKYLRSDGIKFLRFWWDRVGLSLETSKHVSSLELNFSIHSLLDGTEIILIVFPKPREDGEAYFAALVNQPAKKFPFVRVPHTRLITLELVVDKQGSQSTGLAELTPRARHLSLGAGPPAELEQFYATVCKLLEKKVNQPTIRRSYL